MLPLGFERIYSGVEGWRRYAEKWNEVWAGYEVRPEQFIDFGDGRLLLVGMQEARGVASTAAAVKDIAILYTVVNGRVAREQYFFDREQAVQTAESNPVSGRAPL